MDLSVKKAIENLSANGFNTRFFDNMYELKAQLLNEISSKDTIGIGGSMTVYNMGLHNDLINRGNDVYWHWLVDPERRNDIRNKAKEANIYISSSNAITEDGKLINIDGVGNRVASMFYGHDNIYIIAGVNKIVKDYNSGIDRIKNIACPKNAERLNLDTPCRHTGICNDCRAKDRMCRVTVTIDKNPMGGNINVYLINEELGY
ncbi:lactate utilization protein [Dethiothermospora halolimnae]|uniref:lactate utilization protein n=1 Tax=Dethiothermospora halolimnae TaxID=3114390 RepID=UPI003CCC1EBC